MKKGVKMNINVSHILWDCDGNNVDALPLELSLYVRMEEKMDENDAEQLVSDFLSNEFGYCHFGFGMCVTKITDFEYDANDLEFGVFFS